MEIISNARAAGDIRHRIQHPNSHRRAITLVGIGTGGARLAREAAARSWDDVQVVIPDAGTAAAADLDRMLNRADMIFMLACAGDDFGLAPLVKQAGRMHGVPLTSILIQQPSCQQAAPAGLETLRAASDMLVIASDDSYVTDMLEQLGA
jgi:hypothetical protein